jgi:hypothetical protein
MENPCRRRSGGIWTRLRTRDVMRIILYFPIAVVAAPAWAEWVAVSESNDLVAYIEPASIRKTGHFRKVWQVQDLKQRDEHGAMSRRLLIEYDCKDERFRVLATSTHSEPMAAGKTLVSADVPGR